MIKKPKKIVVGITGASGVILGIQLLKVLKKLEAVETHLILSDAAETTLDIETGYRKEFAIGLANYSYSNRDLAARISSGSFITDGMVIIPCSIKTLSSIANSYCSNLMSRAADVMIKEGRKLILVPRETPVHKGHLKLMVDLADLGAVILPPIPAYYHQPTSIDDLIDHTLGKVLDQFQIEHQLFERWE